MKAERRMNDPVMRTLRNAGLNGLIAELLEASIPIAPLGAQVIYLLEPILSTPGGRLGETAKLLENRERIQRLIGELRAEEKQA
jgi:hypothetical protein